MPTQDETTQKPAETFHHTRVGPPMPTCYENNVGVLHRAELVETADTLACAAGLGSSLVR